MILKYSVDYIQSNTETLPTEVLRHPSTSMYSYCIKIDIRLVLMVNISNHLQNIYFHSFKFIQQIIAYP